MSDTGSYSIGVIVGTTRQGRFSEKLSQWTKGIVDAQATLTAQVIDLRDYPLPLFDEPVPPARSAPARAAGWAEAIGDCDGFVIITGEYNFGIPAVLKNALDYAFAEWGRKPAAFVSYGGAGGVRSVEQLRQVCIGLGMAPLRSAVSLAGADFAAAASGATAIESLPAFDEAGAAMSRDLAWWTAALKAAR